MMIAVVASSAIAPIVVTGTARVIANIAENVLRIVHPQPKSTEATRLVAWLIPRLLRIRTIW